MDAENLAVSEQNQADLRGQHQGLMRESSEQGPIHSQQQENAQNVPPQPVALDDQAIKLILDLNSGLEECIKVLSQQIKAEPLTLQKFNEEFSKKFEPLMKMFEGTIMVMLEKISSKIDS